MAEWLNNMQNGLAHIKRLAAPLNKILIMVMANESLGKLAWFPGPRVTK